MDRFRDALAGFFFGRSGGSASRQLRTYGGPALRLGVVFQNHAELHDHKYIGMTSSARG